MPDQRQPKKRLKVAILMGGRSTEREVSLMTGQRVLQALDPEKYLAVPVDAANLGRLPGSAPPALVDGPAVADVLAPERLAGGAAGIMAPDGDPARPDLCFIALHGRYGEDGTIQGLLELLGIPYTGSGVLASAAAMNKVMSKKLFLAEGIPTPAFSVLDRPEAREQFLTTWRAGASSVGVPCVVKPNEQGSTIGITIVRRPEEMPAALDLAFKYDETVLIERFVEGIVGRVLEERREELKVLERDLAPLERVKAPFPRVSYDEAVRILKEKKGLPFEWGSDFGAADETALTEDYDRPFFVHGFPAAVKAFYMKRDPKDDRLSLSCDLLAPEGYGEIVGGGEREDSLDRLVGRIREHELPLEAFEWYLDLRRYGSVPHSGFGMGIERTLTWICGIEHLRETIPFPRMLNRLRP